MFRRLMMGRHRTYYPQTKECTRLAEARERQEQILSHSPQKKSTLLTY
jgi:hypothetical protein